MKTMLRIACLAAPVMLNVAQASTLQPGNLIIGSDLTYPPYNFLKQDKPAGFDTVFIGDSRLGFPAAEARRPVRQTGGIN